MNNHMGQGCERREATKGTIITKCRVYTVDCTRSRICCRVLDESGDVCCSHGSSAVALPSSFPFGERTSVANESACVRSSSGSATLQNFAESRDSIDILQPPLEREAVRVVTLDCLTLNNEHNSPGTY